MAYWVSERIYQAFVIGKPFKDLGQTSQGLITGDNDRFMRMWWEIYIALICFDSDSEEASVLSGMKWFPCNKGGEARKWFGNNFYIVNWHNRGYDMFQLAKGEGRHAQDYYPWCKFKPAMSWSSITSSKPTFRYKVNDLVDQAGMAFFPYNDTLTNFYIAFANSCVGEYLLLLLSPTMNKNAGDIDKLPLIEQYNTNVIVISENCKEISTSDWDSFETSWDFKKHPMI